MSTQAVTHQNHNTERRFLTPPVDIFENKDGLLLMADMPGVSKESLSVTVHDHELTVVGQRDMQVDGEVLHQGIRPEDFQRSFSLHQNIDTSKIEAKLKNGVLTIFLPKSEAVKAREIEIQSV